MPLILKVGKHKTTHICIAHRSESILLLPISSKRITKTMYTYMKFIWLWYSGSLLLDAKSFNDIQMFNAFDYAFLVSLFSIKLI